MGSYLSAPMLVFRSSVLPRACETPCGDGPAGPLVGPLGILTISPLLAPFSLASHHETDGIFYFVVFCRRAPVLLSLAIVSGRFSSLSIFNLIPPYPKASSARWQEGKDDAVAYVGILRTSISRIKEYTCKFSVAVFKAVSTMRIESFKP